MGLWTDLRQSDGTFSGKETVKKKFHLVEWDALIGSKQKEGLGVRNLKTQNQSLMMKWLWRLASSEQALWKELIKQKYEMEGHWTIKLVTSTYGTSLWRAIGNLWQKLRENCSIRTENAWRSLSGRIAG